MSMKISEQGLDLIKKFEGCYLTAYKDRVGVWTIGYGTTNADKDITGKTIKAGMKISKAEAEQWLRKSINAKYGPKVEKYNTKYCWAQNEFDALVSFAFNIGHIDQLTDNGKRSRAEICTAWIKYDKAGGQHVKGLRERREAELKLFKSTPTVSVETGNPYPVPTKTVTSKAVAESAGLKEYSCYGDDVKHVQWELQRIGFDIGTSGVDGSCGDKTASAIGAFQKLIKLVEDKMAGKKTLDALHAAKQNTTAKQEQEEKKQESEKQSKHVDHLALSAKWMKVVYKRIVVIKCKHAGGSTSYEDICKKKKTTCSTSVSAVLQKAGVLQKGKKLGHTKKDGHGGKTKTSYKKAIYGTEYLIPGTYDIVKIGKKYHDMPSKYKKPGIVYVQDSNICMCAGNGYIYSTNQGTIQYKHGHYVKDKVKSGYPFTSKILYAIIPRS